MSYTMPGGSIYVVTVEKGEYSDWMLVPFRSYARQEDAEAFVLAAEAAKEAAAKLERKHDYYMRKEDPGGALLRPFVPSDWFSLDAEDLPEYEVVAVSHDAPWPGKEVK